MKLESIETKKKLAVAFSRTKKNLMKFRNLLQLFKDVIFKFL
jgi:hypothetical protein